LSLHANVRIQDRGRERLAKPCRYAGRPPVVDERLARDQRGDGLYSVKKSRSTARPTSSSSL